ncbi:MAG TPA: protein YgfX [Rhodanobacteraceae bacterium]|nr:protein YgfX [Rhodanobacteraceae bacterium]
MRTPPAVAFEYRRSPSLIVATIMMALLAIAALWISGLPRWLRVALPVLVGGYAGVALGRLLRPRIRSLLWRADGGFDLTLDDTLADGRREVQGTIQNARIMGPLIVLTLRWPPRERAALWLLPDNLDADTRRRLRMRLGAVGTRAAASGNADSG